MTTSSIHHQPITETLGMAAIRYLESLQGFSLNDDQCRAQWRKLAPHDQHLTVSLYREFVLED